jgi:hypothetical protein
VRLHLDKPWIPLDAAHVARVPGQLGVYQLADASGQVRYIGFAGGRALFGLRSELAARIGAADCFRYEVNMQYQTRYRELLMLHRGAHGELPLLNQAEPPLRLGRLG